MHLPTERKEAFELYTALKQTLQAKTKSSSELRDQQLQSSINKKVTIASKPPPADTKKVIINHRILKPCGWIARLAKKFEMIDF